MLLRLQSSKANSCQGQLTVQPPGSPSVWMRYEACFNGMAMYWLFTFASFRTGNEPALGMICINVEQ